MTFFGQISKRLKSNLLLNNHKTQEKKHLFFSNKSANFAGVEVLHNEQIVSETP